MNYLKNSSICFLQVSDFKSILIPMSVKSYSEGLSKKTRSRRNLRQSCSDTILDILPDSTILDKYLDDVSSIVMEGSEDKIN